MHLNSRTKIHFFLLKKNHNLYVQCMYSKHLLNMFTLYAMGYGSVFLREMTSWASLPSSSVTNLSSSAGLQIKIFQFYDYLYIYMYLYIVTPANLWGNHWLTAAKWRPCMYISYTVSSEYIIFLPLSIMTPSLLYYDVRFCIQIETLNFVIKS